MRSGLLLLSEGRTLFYVTLMITLLQSHSSELVELGARAGAEQGGGDLIREFGKSSIYHFMSKLSPHFVGLSLLHNLMMTSTRLGMNKAYLGQQYADSSVSHKCHQDLFLDSYYNQIYGMRFAD